MSEFDLVDDVALVNALLTGADLGATVTRALEPDSGQRPPIVLYDLDGSDDPAIVNGPGLWEVVLSVWVFGVSEAQVWDVAKRVHSTVTRWDVPGVGVLPGVAGVERASTLQKFRDVWDTDLTTRQLKESNAQFSLLIRSY